jgi:uncharacterized protein YrrD
MDTWKRAAGMPVISQEEGAALGKLDDFQFDLESLEIYGWSLRGQGMFSQNGGVAAEELLLIGKDVALIRSIGIVEWGREKRKGIDGRCWASRYMRTDVLNRKGESLGAIRDIVIDPAGNEVRGLIMNTGKLLPIGEGVVIGTDSVIVGQNARLLDLDEDETSESFWKRLRSVFRKKDQG